MEYTICHTSIPIHKKYILQLAFAKIYKNVGPFSLWLMNIFYFTFFITVFFLLYLIYLAEQTKAML